MENGFFFSFLFFRGFDQAANTQTKGNVILLNKCLVLENILTNIQRSFLGLFSFPCLDVLYEI